MRLGPLALLLPQPAQAHGGAQLPGFGLLAAGDGQGLLEAGFSLGRIRDCLPQQEFALEPIRLWEQVTPPTGLEGQQGLYQQALPLPDSASLPQRFSQ